MTSGSPQTWCPKQEMPWAACIWSEDPLGKGPHRMAGSQALSSKYLLKRDDSSPNPPPRTSTQRQVWEGRITSVSQMKILPFRTVQAMQKANSQQPETQAYLLRMSQDDKYARRRSKVRPAPDVYKSWDPRTPSAPLCEVKGNSSLGFCLLNKYSFLMALADLYYFC